jgi:UDP-N-acetyl-2-amino-2-deoxyglucuronate dehydrogenase
VNGTEAMKAMKIILAAYKSQKTGKAVELDGLHFSTLEMKDSDVRYQ